MGAALPCGSDLINRDWTNNRLTWIRPPPVVDSGCSTGCRGRASQRLTLLGEGRLCACCAVRLGAGIPESWLTIPAKAALPLIMPTLKVVQTLPISQGFIETGQKQGTKWSGGVGGRKNFSRGEWSNTLPAGLGDWNLLGLLY